MSTETLGIIALLSIGVAWLVFYFGEKVREKEEKTKLKKKPSKRKSKKS